MKVENKIILNLILGILALIFVIVFDMDAWIKTLAGIFLFIGSIIFLIALVRIKKVKRANEK